MATRELRVSFTGDTKDLDRAFQKVDRGLKKTSSEADKSGGKIRGFATVTSKGFSRVGIAAGGMATAGAAGAAFLAKSFVTGASDINESLTKNQVLFGKYADSVDRFSKRSAGSLGISRAAALEAVGTFGNLFNALEVAPQKSARLSTSLVKLAADMASFNNASPEETLDALRSGLVGETEPLRRFGVNINDAQLRQQALQMGLVKSTKEVLPANAKALAAVALITKQTSAAHGDFARTSGGLANQQRILKARLADAGAELGVKLMPAALAGVRAINSLFDSSSKGGKAVAAMGRMASDAAGWIKGAWSTAVAAVGRFIARNREDIQSVGRAMRNIGIAIRAVVDNVIVPAAKRLFPALRDAFEGVLQMVRGVIRVISGVLTGNWRKAWAGLKDIAAGAIKDVVSLLKGAGGLLLAGAKAAGRAIGKGILAGLGNLGHLILAKVKDSLGFVASAMTDPGGFLSGIGKSIGKSIAGAVGDGPGRELGPIGGGDFGGSLMGAQSALAPFAAIGSRFGLGVSSGRRPGSITSSGNVSYHSSGEAIDLADGRGPDSNKLRFFNYMKNAFGGRLAELIYTPGGAGIKNGRPYRYGGQVAADHYDHVHVAFDTGRPGVGDGLGKFKATSYGPPWGGIQGTGVTATGVNLKGAPHRYGIAVDPRVIPLGSRVKVTPNPFGYSGLFTAFDTGGAIKGRRIDFYDWRGRKAQNRWGARTVSVSTTGNGKGGAGAAGGPGGAALVGAQIQGMSPHGGMLGGLLPGVGGSGTFGAAGGGMIGAAAKSQAVLGKPSAPLSGPNELDYLNAAAANATLTDTTADDIKAATGIRDYYQKIYNQARRTKDPRDDIQAAQDLRGAIDALKQFQADSTSLADALKSLKDEMKRQTDFAASVQNTESNVLKRTFADLMSGQLAGPGVASRRLTPGYGVQWRY